MRGGQVLLRTLPKVAAVTAATLAAQVYYTVQRNLPSYEGFSATTRVGSGGSPMIRMAAFGDSTLTGPGLTDPSHIWIRQAIARLEDRYVIELVSYAEGGSRTEDVLDRQVAQLGETDVSVVVVGSNDALHGVPASVVKANIAAIAHALLDRSQVLILAGVGDLGSIPRMPSPLHSVARLRGNQIDAVIAEVAAASDRIERVPMWDLTASRFQRDRDLIFAGDLFHPNEHGHRIWADAFYPSLIRAIERILRERYGSEPQLGDQLPHPNVM